MSGALELPKTFEAVQQAPRRDLMCVACGQKRAVATISVTLAQIGAKHRSTIAQLRRIPVCEPCGATVYGMNRKALKQ